MDRSTARCSARRCAWSAHSSAARWAWWLGAGVCAGLALLSKYSAVLTIVGAVLYLLSSRAHRHWLATPKPWLAALVALLMFAPVLVWNATHDWVSFAFQAGRAAGMQLPATRAAGHARRRGVVRAAVDLAADDGGVRRGAAPRPARVAGLAAVLPGRATDRRVRAVSAWSSQRVLFHWAAPGYLMLFPLLGDAVARRLDRPAVRRALAGTAVFVVLGMAVVATQVRFDWLHSASPRRRQGPGYRGDRLDVAARRRVAARDDRRRARTGAMPGRSPTRSAPT